jgi:hypothetical protein
VLFRYNTRYIHDIRGWVKKWWFKKPLNEFIAGYLSMLESLMNGEILRISLCPDNCVFQAYLSSEPSTILLLIPLLLQKYERGNQMNRSYLDNIRMQVA